MILIYVYAWWETGLRNEVDSFNFHRQKTTTEVFFSYASNILLHGIARVWTCQVLRNPMEMQMLQIRALLGNGCPAWKRRQGCLDAGNARDDGYDRGHRAILRLSRWLLHGP